MNKEDFDINSVFTNNNENNSDEIIVKENKDDVFFGKPNTETERLLKEKDVDSIRETSPIKKNKPARRLQRATSIILAIVLVVVSFCLGGLASFVYVNSDVAFATWAVNQLNKYAYFVTEDITIYDLINKGILNTVNDPYLAVYSPDETKKMLQSNEGVSLSIGMTIGEYLNVEGLYVFSVVGNSSADRNGVKEDYRVVSVDGIDFWNKELSELTNYISTLPDNQDTTVVFALPQYEDDFVTHSLDNTVTCILRRESFVEKIVYYYDNNSLAFSDLLDNNTAYIQLKSFMGDTAKQFDEAMELFYKNGKHNLILDLRDNTGGSEVNLQSVASHLLKDSQDSNEVLILTEEYKDGSERSLFTKDSKYNRYQFDKIIVLVNGLSASASEALLMAMIDYNNVDVIIGEKTYGKGTGLQTMIMPITNYAITFTVSYFLSPLGRSNDIVGISPTSGYVVTQKVNQFPFSYSKDNQFMRAVNYLK